MRVRSMLLATFAVGALVLGAAQPASAATIDLSTSDKVPGGKLHWYKSSGKLNICDVENDGYHTVGLIQRYWPGGDAENVDHSQFFVHKKDGGNKCTSFYPKKKIGNHTDIARDVSVCLKRPNSNKLEYCSEGRPMQFR